MARRRLVKRMVGTTCLPSDYCAAELLGGSAGASGGSGGKSPAVGSWSYPCKSPDASEGRYLIDLGKPQVAKAMPVSSIGPDKYQSLSEHQVAMVKCVGDEGYPPRLPPVAADLVIAMA